MKSKIVVIVVLIVGLWYWKSPIKAQTTTFDKAIAAAGLDNVTRDYSDSDIIEVEEPLCAYANITGLDTMPQAKGYPQNAWMDVYLGNGCFFRKRAIIDAQGNSSLAFEKKNFKVDFCDDEWAGEVTPKISFGDWVKQDSYHFKAYYTDYLRGAGTVALDLYDQIAQSSGRPWTRALDHIAKPKADARCYPLGFPCIVYLNGEFYGIFAWQLKKHRDNMNQKRDVATHIHLDGTLNDDTFWKSDAIDWTKFEVRNPKELYCMDGTLYDGDHPKELIDEGSPFFSDNDPEVKSRKELTAQVKHHIERLNQMNAVLLALKQQGNVDEVRQAFEESFDVTTLVDYACHHHVTANFDGFSKNWQWFTYDGKKWYVTPYDLDCTFGNHFSGNFVSDAQYTGVCDRLEALYPIGPVDWLANYYQDQIKQRYHELRQESIIDAVNICSLLSEWYTHVGEDNYAREWERWPNSKCISETIANDGWQQSDWSNYWNLPTWNDSTAYNTGNRVVLNSMTWEATAPTIGVKPWAQLGYTDSLERFMTWIDKRIALLDKHFDYNGLTTVMSHSENDSSKTGKNVYTLSGQRLSKPRNGLNIVDGKKIWMR
ncbi:MAG: CotH kinase family protein [Prevotella sp.]|nr:CotH kinase family protein [Prevotella sp.]